MSESLQKLQTDIDSGLSEAEAAARLKRDGPNALTPPAKTPEWLKFLKVMFGGFAALLWAAAVACFVAVGIDMARGETQNLDNAYIGGALVVVVVVTGLFTYYQENKSTKIMESFDKMLPPMALVVRDGQSKELAATELVVGDIVEIKGGVKTPADIRCLLHFLYFISPPSFSPSSSSSFTPPSPLLPSQGVRVQRPQGGQLLPHRRECPGKFTAHSWSCLTVPCARSP